MARRGFFRRWFVVPASALMAVLAASGCVERRYTIRSDPPGALAVVNGEEIGRTPVSRGYTYYGDREVVLMLDGYQTKRAIQPIKAPWYDNLLTEIFTENLLLFTLRDDRDFTYKMDPETVPPADELVSRAQILRSQAASMPAPRRGGLLGWLGF